ncbi:MAG TPA: inorganic phosphate transporter, partial [Anaerolineales bacterium]|nr:inorganic phosphate transporter [Anaerolineales bacterium]
MVQSSAHPGGELLALLVGLAVFFAFFNGYRDSSSILAGVFASRAMRPRVALYLVGAAELIAPFLVGSAVARAVTTGLVDVQAISLGTLVIAMASATLWSLLCWWLGIPSSSTHALIGGIVGATWVIHGWSAISGPGLLRVVLPLLAAPFVGFLVGFALMGVLLLVFSGATPRVNILFRRLQVVTAVLLAMSNSANDSQKSVGIITLGLVLAGRAASFDIPFWALAACAGAMALGASRGDWRQIRNLGGRVFRIRPLNALASQGASTAVVLTASALGMPVSTSHIISTSLMGSGASERVNKVRWHIAAEMATAWILTIPATMLVSIGIFLASNGVRLWGPG